jgi:hypothetical protein
MNEGERSCQPAHQPSIPSLPEPSEEGAIAVLQSIAGFQHPDDVLHRRQEPGVLARNLPTSIDSIPTDEATEILDGGGEKISFLVN